jgi:hypothetical protein
VAENDLSVSDSSQSSGILKAMFAMFATDAWRSYGVELIGSPCRGGMRSTGAKLVFAAIVPFERRLRTAPA